MAYASTLQFIIEGSQDRNSNRAEIWMQELMQRPWRGAACWLVPHGFLIEPRTTSPGVAPPTMNWDLLNQSPNKKTPYRLSIA